MPVLATYYIENYKIEVFKAYFAGEKVLVNGRTVSEKSASDTTPHQFTIDEDRYRVSRRKSSQAEKLNAFEVLKNESPVALVNIESESSTKMLLLIVAVGLGCGFLIGVLLYNTL